MENAEVHVFVVDREDMPSVGVEEFHAVVVVPHRAFLAGPGAASRLVERGRIGPERVAPARDDVPAVSLGRVIVSNAFAVTASKPSRLPAIAGPNALAANAAVPNAPPT